MSSFQLPEARDSAVNPTVEIPEYWQQTTEDYYEDQTTPRQTKLPPLPVRSKKSKGKRKGTSSYQSGSDTEKDSPKMSSRTSRHHHSSSSSGSKKDKSSSKSATKTDDWSEVTEPEERRRIQNRIAQRKFREKAREQKDRAQRDAQNQEHAASSYHIPSPDELSMDAELSGLPWGSINIAHMVAKGHESASQQSSRRASDHRQDDTQFLSPYGGGYTQMTSFDGLDSSGDDRYYDDSPYYPDFDTGDGMQQL